MVKPLLLLLCCVVLFHPLRAQTPGSDTVVPQKLQLVKADPAWTARPAYFSKKNNDKETDSVRSLMYKGPAKKDSMDLRLPVTKSNKVDVQVKAGQREPLFRRQ